MLLTLEHYDKHLRLCRYMYECIFTKLKLSNVIRMGVRKFVILMN